MLADASSYEAWLLELEAKNRAIRAFESLAPRPFSGVPTFAAPLAGIPIGVKALFAADGFPTTAGSALPPELFSMPEATAVHRLKAAGANVLGKTKTDEFAYADPPDTKNPHDPTRTPGGSSAGSAAAVAAGLCPIALGTQTSRSIIAPASFCGVVGFKPSYGRIPCDGVVLLSPAMDTVGTLATSVADTEVVARVLVDGWVEPSGIGPARIGVISPTLRKSILEGTPALDAYEQWIAKQAWPTVTFRWEHDIQPVYQSAMDLLHGEMAEVHQTWFAQHGDRYREMSRKGIERGRSISPDRLSELRSWTRGFRQEIAEDLAEAGIDVLVLPSQPFEAPPLGKITGYGHTTIPWSVSGLPCVSIPWRQVDGLPLGLQGVAAHGMDEVLLQTMRSLESHAADSALSDPDETTPPVTQLG
jgi:Asp-tRNA(Asn)/Glu-tRNA(Gln) amidotransferase A subunit family amidase